MFQLNGIFLVSGAHNYAEGRLSVPDQFLVRHILIQHLKLKSLILFKKVLNLECSLKLGVQIVVYAFGLAKRGPTFSPFIPVVNLADWVTF